MKYVGRLVTGDFEDNTMTFLIEGEMVLQAGKYAIEQIKLGNNFDSESVNKPSLPSSGLHDKNGVELKLGDVFTYKWHAGYLLDDFKAEVVFENGAFCYKIIEGYDQPYNTPFCEHDELQSDFLDYVEVVGK